MKSVFSHLHALWVLKINFFKKIENKNKKSLSVTSYKNKAIHFYVFGILRLTGPWTLTMTAKLRANSTTSGKAMCWVGLAFFEPLDLDLFFFFSSVKYGGFSVLSSNATSFLECNLYNDFLTICICFFVLFCFRVL